MKKKKSYKQKYIQTLFIFIYIVTFTCALNLFVGIQVSVLCPFILAWGNLLSVYFGLDLPVKNSLFVFLGMCSFTLHFWVIVCLDMEFLVDYLFLLSVWIGHSIAIWSLWVLLRKQLLILLRIQSVLGISSCSCFQGPLFVFHFGHFINLSRYGTMSYPTWSTLHFLNIKIRGFPSSHFF